jgi:2-polyprenyl-6-methoxyphenol hydroxylase-like FAD-dependent oxidoreductase
MSKGLVLIVGAGPTGLVLALWLTRLGVHVRIIDKAPEPGTTSRAVAVQARTLELYRQVNISDAVVGGGVQVAAANLWVRGAQVARLPLGRLGEGLSPFPYALTYPQDAHERLLIERLNALSVRVERRTELLRFNEEAHSVRAVLRRPNGSEEVCEAAYLAGCDGASSIVREALGTGFPGGTYSGVFYVADVNADGLAANGEIHVELDEADFLAVFPLKRTGHLRLIGPVSRAPSRDEELTFADIELRAIGKLKLAIASVNWFSTYRVHHRVATRFRVGRAFLLGDAAHIHSPVGGQGMNTGIGDAVNLAWKLAAVLNHGAGDELLATYEIERIGFARRLVATTDRAFSVVTRRGGIARLLRTRLVPAVAAKLFRFAAISPSVLSHRVADRSQLSRQPSQHRDDRRRTRRRSLAMGRDRSARRRQLRASRLATLAGPYIWGTADRRRGRLCGPWTSIARLRLAARHAKRGSETGRALSRQTRRLHRPGRASCRPATFAWLF